MGILGGSRIKPSERGGSFTGKDLMDYRTELSNRGINLSIKTITSILKGDTNLGEILGKDTAKLIRENTAGADGEMTVGL